MTEEQVVAKAVTVKAHTITKDFRCILNGWKDKKKDRVYIR